MKRMRLALCAMALTACQQTTQPAMEPDLPYVRDYRAEGDQCFLIGESPDTVEYLDDAADLVACPADYEGLGVFVTETSAVEVDRLGTFVLYSVPRR